MQEFKHNRYKNPSLQRIAVNWDDKYFPLFERVKNNWNLPIRNFYKKIMGVTLMGEENSRRQEIKIAIKPIANERIITRIENDFSDLDFERIQKIQSFLSASKNALCYFAETPGRYDALEDLIDFSEAILKDFELEAFNKQLLDLLCYGNPDIFGSYTGSGHDNTNGNIELYIIPCVLFCELNHLDLSAFITIVLAHELAHGYNHLGIDKDNYYWENFWRTESALAEGLAQYYTSQFIEKHQIKNPRGMEIFELLLKYQNSDYTSFQTWSATPEKIYAAFIETRRNNITRCEDFLSYLTGAKARLKGDKKMEAELGFDFSL